MPPDYYNTKKRYCQYRRFVIFCIFWSTVYHAVPQRREQSNSMHFSQRLSQLGCGGTESSHLVSSRKVLSPQPQLSYPPPCLQSLGGLGRGGGGGRCPQESEPSASMVSETSITSSPILRTQCHGTNTS